MCCVVLCCVVLCCVVLYCVVLCCGMYRTEHASLVLRHKGLGSVFDNYQIVPCSNVTNGVHFTGDTTIVYHTNALEGGRGDRVR